ncbi:MAG TPA: hypothetical protein VJR30_19755 [Bradyrhizobium sp.]|nr:hypothetical protein [Bradyrhizobium sp.]
MSRARPEDLADVTAPARAQASIEPVEISAAPRTNWRDRWVEIAQSVPPIPGKAGSAAIAADARAAEAIVTPIRVMLALLVLLLALGAFELVVRRPGRRAD